MMFKRVDFPLPDRPRRAEKDLGGKLKLTPERISGPLTAYRKARSRTSIPPTCLAGWSSDAHGRGPPVDSTNQRSRNNFSRNLTWSAGLCPGASTGGLSGGCETGGSSSMIPTLRWSLTVSVVRYISLAFSSISCHTYLPESGIP